MHREDDMTLTANPPYMPLNTSGLILQHIIQIIFIRETDFIPFISQVIDPKPLL